MKPRRRRLFVMGAGASYAVGLPDAARVLTQLTLYTSGPYVPVQNRLPMALLGDVTDCIIRFAKEAGVTKGDRFPLDAIAERFYATWQQNPNFYVVVMGFWQALCEFLFERSAARAHQYRRFANALVPGDIVISFNWDTSLEMALHRAKKAFTLSLEPQARSARIRVLKPHGSVDFAVADGPGPHCPPRRFFEMVHPVMPGVQTPAGYKQPHLYRLLTYDLAFRVNLTWRGPNVDLQFSKAKPSHGPSTADVGPLHLRGFLSESMPYLLTPGSPGLWYDWSYTSVRQIVEPCAPEVREIFVAGYSFPPYDEGVRTLLRSLSRSIGPVPVHIINPAARELPRDVLDSMFSSCELHPCGFLDYAWRRPRE